MNSHTTSSTEGKKKVGRPKKYWAYFEGPCGLSGKQAVPQRDVFHPREVWYVAFHNRIYAMLSLDGAQTTMDAPEKHIMVFEYRDRGRDWIRYRFKEIK